MPGRGRKSPDHVTRGAAKHDKSRSLWQAASVVVWPDRRGCVSATTAPCTPPGDAPGG